MTLTHNTDALDHAPHTNTSTLLANIAHAATVLASTNCDLRHLMPTPFDAVEPAAMPVENYLLRIRKYTRFDDTCFLVALSYLGRLTSASGAPYCLTPHNVHRLLIAAIVLASKSSDDTFHANGFMAQCGGVSIAELNALELEMCKRIHWALVVEADELAQLYAALADMQAPYWEAWRNPKVPLCSSSPLAAPLAADDNDEDHTGASREDPTCNVDSPPRADILWGLNLLWGKPAAAKSKFDGNSPSSVTARHPLKRNAWGL